MLHSEDVIAGFMNRNKNSRVKTLKPKCQYVDTDKIIAINKPYEYPEILNGHKMIELKKSIKTASDWDMDDEKASNLELLKFPNGDMVVNGNGNHRAVLAKELGIKSIKANVHEVKYCTKDTD